MTKKFKERFDAIAESYDADRGEFSLMDALLIVGSSGKVRGCKVLDIGTGTGIVAFEFAKRVGEDGEVIGIDISEPMLQRAREKARKGGISNIKFDVGSFTNIPLASESIDVVVSSTALHHVEPQEKPKAFSEMWRVMKPGGRLVIHDCMYEDEEWRKIFTDLDSLKSYLEKIRLPKERMDFVLGLTQSSTGIIRTFREEYVESVGDIRKYAEGAGFRDIKIEVIYKPLPSQWILRATLRRFVHSIQWFWTILARRDFL